MSGKSVLICFFCIICFCSAGCLPVAAADAGYFSGGAGTTDDPYLISTPSDLMNLSGAVNDWADSGRYAGCAYLVTAPLDMSGMPEWRPIGIHDYDFPTNNYSIFKFRGVFDGSHQRITGLSGTAREGSGLFYGTENAVLKNICLENVSLRGEGLADSAMQTQIESCSVFGTVAGLYAGGLINDGSFCRIVNSSVSGTVTGEHCAGGLAGSLRDTVVENCRVSATVISGRVVDDGRMRAGAWEGTGGLAGSSAGCRVEDCFFSGTVSCEGNYTGGLVGTTGGDSYLCCGMAGEVRGESCVGGFAGYAAGTIFSDCFTAGEVSAAKTGCGGFVGKADPGVSLVRCYAAGETVAARCFAGGAAGMMENGTVEDCVILYRCVTGLENTSAVIGAGSLEWPVTLGNVSVWEGMQAGDLQDLPAGAGLISSGEILGTAPGNGRWQAFSADVWEVSYADWYRLPILTGWDGMVLPDVSYLRSGPVMPETTESPFSGVSICTGFGVAAFILRMYGREK